MLLKFNNSDAVDVARLWLRRRGLATSVMLVGHEQRLQLELRCGAIFLDQTAARTLVPHLVEPVFTV